MVPAMLLHVESEIAYRQQAVREDYARSRRAPRPQRAARPPALRRWRSALRVLHA